MMKRNVRVMALLLALILALSLMMTGCGGGTGSEGESTDQTEQIGDAESEAKPDSEDTVFLSTWRPMGANRPVKYFLSGGIDYEYVTDERIIYGIKHLLYYLHVKELKDFVASLLISLTPSKFLAVNPQCILSRSLITSNNVSFSCFA